MDQLVSDLCDLRLGITKNINISPYILKDNFFHCSAIIREKKRNVFYVVSIGQNKYVNRTISTSRVASKHAEEAAIDNLPPLKRSNRPMNVNLVVIKTTKTKILGNSSPCIHCLKIMKEKAVLKGYNIIKIYYSNSNGVIVCRRLNDLIISDYLYISSYYKLTNYNVEKWLKWRQTLNIC